MRGGKRCDWDDLFNYQMTSLPVLSDMQNMMD